MHSKIEIISQIREKAKNVQIESITVKNLKKHDKKKQHEIAEKQQYTKIRTIDTSNTS